MLIAKAGPHNRIKPRANNPEIVPKLDLLAVVIRIWAVMPRRNFIYAPHMKLNDPITLRVFDLQVSAGSRNDVGLEGSMLSNRVNDIESEDRRLCVGWPSSVSIPSVRKTHKLLKAIDLVTML